MTRTTGGSYRFGTLACLLGFSLISSLWTSAANAQGFFIGGNAGNAPGVWVDADGTVKRRELDDKTEMTVMRARAKAAIDADKNQKLGFVSLPKAFAAAKAAIDAGKPVPDDAKYLGGLTRIDFLFVYPESGDVVICGPAEAVHEADAQHAFGKKTGRPVMRLEDFVVAMRVVHGVGGGTFGCRLDPDPAAPARITDVMQKLAKATRAERIKGVLDATGPQKVSFFGRVPPDTRFALVTVAADYELKRYGLGLAKTTVLGLGNIVDNTRQAVNMIWYELAYDPILVSPAGDSYGLRGPRLKVLAGSFNWDPKGATSKAYDFAKKMSANIPAIANTQPLVAELQNIGDLSVIAALIQRDGLDRKVNWDTAWILRESGDQAASFPVTRVTVPKVADALANYTNGAIACGGVVLSPAQMIKTPAEKDAKGALEAAKKQGAELRKAAKPDVATVVEQ